MKKMLLKIVVAILAATAVPCLSLATDYSPYVVELSTVYQVFDPTRPWAKMNPAQTGSFGVVVPGPYILTTARSIRNATLIKVGKYGAPPTSRATVFHRDEDVNLAVIAVDDKDFFNDLKVADLADSLPSGNSVYSVRWNNGQLETSSSRVSRIQVLSGPLSDLQHAFLLASTDISGGGLAEPVFYDSKLVGLTVYQDRSDMARILPAEIISSYLEALNTADGYAGFAYLGAGWQSNRDPALAEFLGMKENRRGVIIGNAAWGTTAFGKLEPKDVLLSLDGHEIDAEGYYSHPRYGKLNFMNILTDGRRAGDLMNAVVLRGGEQVEIELELKRYTASARLISWRESDDPPPYFIAGGFIFIELDIDYLASWGKRWRKTADTRLLTYLELEKEAQRADRKKIIILSGVLPDAYNIGYQDMRDLAVSAVNGSPIDSIAAAVEAFDSPKDGFHVIEFFPNRIAAQAVLDASTFEAASGAILQKYSIPNPMRLQ